MANNVWGEIQQAQQRKEAIRENAAREATLAVTYRTEGSGELIPTQPVVFEVPFFAEPSMVSGVVLSRLPDRRYYRLPTVTAGVMRWQQNDRGFFTGAFLYFRVVCDLVPGLIAVALPRAEPALIHHLRFTGPAYKPMSPEVNASMLDDGVRPLRPPAR